MMHTYINKNPIYLTYVFVSFFRNEIHNIQFKNANQERSDSVLHMYVSTLELRDAREPELIPLNNMYELGIEFHIKPNLCG